MSGGKDGILSSKKRALVVGAGGAGREVLSWAVQMRQEEWEVAGFLDANPNAIGPDGFPFAILGNPADWSVAADEVFIVGLGDPAVRMRVCLDLKSRGARFVSVIHPSVVMGIGAEVGEGAVLSPYVVVSACARIGDFAFINIAASIGHDSRIGDGATISAHCDVMGYVEIGRGCLLGSHACVLPKKKVGDGAIVGAGSAVVRNVAPNTTVMGVPAQLLASR